MHLPEPATPMPAILVVMRNQAGLLIQRTANMHVYPKRILSLQQ